MLLGMHLEPPLWHGLRVVAADGSKMMLFLQDASKRFLGEATAFALYLPGLEMTLSAQLYESCVGERQMLFEHLEHLKPNDLLVLDRGYPCLWLIAYLTQHTIQFCMRADNLNFAAVKTFLRSGKHDQIVTLNAPSKLDCQAYECERKPTQVRLIRVITPNGRIHVLITSLLDSQAYPAEDFSALYHSRWRVEEAFKRLKHHLALENTSGLTWLAAQQDFHAKILADNLHSLTVLAATSMETIAVSYKINRTYAFAYLKRCLPRWLLITLPSANKLIETFSTLAKNLIRMLPEDSKPRSQRSKPHRKHAYKSTV